MTPIEIKKSETIVLTPAEVESSRREYNKVCSHMVDPPTFESWLSGRWGQKADEVKPATGSDIGGYKSIADNYRESSDRAAIVSDDYPWLPIDSNTPRGSKLQLINRDAGVAVYGTLGTHPGFWTHWAPMPTFKD